MSDLGGVIAIIRLRSLPVDDRIVDALAAGGIRFVEATLPTPGSLDLVARRRDDPEVTLGVGTVRTTYDVDLAAAAGARFLVTPTTVPAVLAAARAHALPVLCGALTPTEIDRAWSSGAAAVKVFPIDAVGGASYLRAVAAPLHDVRFVPTGGVTVEAAEHYAAIGCTGVGVGSSLVSEQAVIDADWDGITARARAFRDAWDRGVAARG